MHLLLPPLLREGFLSVSNDLVNDSAKVKKSVAGKNDADIEILYFYATVILPNFSILYIVKSVRCVCICICITLCGHSMPRINVAWFCTAYYDYYTVLCKITLSCNLIVHYEIFFLNNLLLFRIARAIINEQ